jgi:hypothetical protein
VFARLTDWSIGLLASGSAADLVDRVGQIAGPAWLVPFIWILWGLGLVAMLLVTLVGSRFVRVLRPGQAARAP